MKNQRLFGVELANAGNYQEALHIFEECARNGNIHAINDAGVIYDKRGDYKTAMMFYQLAAVYGSATAIYNIGKLFEYGRGVLKSDAAALLYYRRAASLKCSYAYFKFAEFYRTGRAVKKDEVRAFNILKMGEKLERKTKTEFSSTVQLGYYYENGIGTKVNYRRALKCYKNASKKGSGLGSYNAGIICLKLNRGNEAIECFQRAASQKYYDAYAALAIEYINGRVVKKNSKLACEFVALAANKGSWKGMITYADFCLGGEISDPDFKKAKKWLARYLLFSGEYYEDYLESYNILKDGYRNLIDWADLERDPTKYLKSEEDR